MKTKLAIAFVVMCHLFSAVCPAQDKPKADAPEATSILLDGEEELVGAIRILARQAGLNILIDPALTETTKGPDGQPLPARKLGAPLRLEKVSYAQALDAVLNSYGLEMIPDPKDPKNGIARITKKDPARLEPLISKVYQLKYASSTNMIPIITATISSRGKTIADTRTGQLLVVATEKEMEQVDGVMEKFDTPTKQVLVEARILETSRNPQTLKGIDWSGTLQNQNFGFGNGFTSGSTTTTLPGATTTKTINLPGGGTATVASTAPSTESTLLNTAIGQLAQGGISVDTMRGFSPGVAFLSADGVAGVLSFLNTDSDTEVVATPRAVMSDNQTAKLSVVRSVPIFKITPGSANSPAGVEILYKDIGTSLEVTPRIAGNNVSMKITPEVSNVDSKDSQTVNGQAQTANIFAVRKIDTQVMIPSGNTLVMGGLLSDTTIKAHTKVPLLGDLPGLGLAFRKDTKSRAKANLLIFITPTIVTDGDFAPTSSDFMKNKFIDKPEIEDGPWDSGKPKQWGKKKNVE
ncbi:MAG: hypothetical protein HZA89_09790 [Verrucomicrobia bacterium]|nr:hypothetical protein [Verrucomicrobiota bacterium]